MDTAEVPPAEQIEPADNTPRLDVDRRTLGLARTAFAAAVLTTGVVLGLLAWSPWSSSGMTKAQNDTVRTRDAATKAANEAVVALNTADPQKDRQTVEKWLTVSSGALHRKLALQRTQIAADIRRKGDATSARVLEEAVSVLDQSAGRATVLSVIEVRTTPRRGKTAVAVRRVRLLMQHIDSTWRVTYLETMSSR